MAYSYHHRVSFKERNKHDRPLKASKLIPRGEEVRVHLPQRLRFIHRSEQWYQIHIFRIEFIEFEQILTIWCLFEVIALSLVAAGPLPAD